MIRTGFNNLPAVIAALFLLSPALAVGGEASSDGDAPGEAAHWNELDLLEFVGAMAGPERGEFSELATVASFERLQSAIEEVKQLVLHDAQNEQEAIEGLRMILKHLTVATIDSVQNDFRNPLFAKRDPRNRDIGAYNPDAEYDQAYIDGRYDYKLTGQLGSVPYVSITLNGSGKTQLSRALGYLNDAAIRKHVGADGSFTLWLTKEKPTEPGAWLPIADEANGVIIRQYLTDRSEQELATFAIEAIGDPLPDIERTSDADIAGRLEMVANYLLVSSTWHRTLLPQMREQPNTFVSSTGSSIGASAANTENYYQMAYFEMAEGEQLVVDFAPPETVFWNLTSASIWHETKRYLTDPSSLTSKEAARSEDGRVRFVLSSADPGHPNWIKTFGHERGFLILRMVGVKTNPLATITRVAPAGGSE